MFKCWGFFWLLILIEWRFRLRLYFFIFVLFFWQVELIGSRRECISCEHHMISKIRKEFFFQSHSHSNICWHKNLAFKSLVQLYFRNSDDRFRTIQGLLLIKFSKIDLAHRTNVESWVATITHLQTFDFFIKTEEKRFESNVYSIGVYKYFFVKQQVFLFDDASVLIEYNKFFRWFMCTDFFTRESEIGYCSSFYWIV